MVMSDEKRLCENDDDDVSGWARTTNLPVNNRTRSPIALQRLDCFAKLCSIEMRVCDSFVELLIICLIKKLMVT